MSKKSNFYPLSFNFVCGMSIYLFRFKTNENEKMENENWNMEKWKMKNEIYCS
jgi:hypothetical protein